MSQKNTKLIKRFCKTAGIKSKKIINVFKTYSPQKKTQMYSDMRKSLHASN